MNPVASYVMSNTMALLIFEANSNSVLAGATYEEAEWCEVDYKLVEDDDNETEMFFKWGEIEVPLSHCMRI